MYRFLTKSQPLPCLASTVTANGITVRNGLSSISKTPFGLQHKTLPLQPILSSKPIANGHNSHFNDHIRPPKGLVKRTLSSLHCVTKNVVYPNLLVFLKGTWFFFRIFCGDLSDVVPYFVRLADQEGRPVDPAIRPFLLDEEAASIKSETSSIYSTEETQIIPNTSYGPLAPSQRTFSPYPVNFVVAYFKNCETQERLNSRSSQVSFNSSEKIAEFFASAPPCSIPTLPTSIVFKNSLKASAGWLPPVTSEWKKINFKYYENLTQQVLSALETNKSLSVDDLNSQVGALYRILKREVLDKVKDNCIGEGNRMSELVSTISSIEAAAKGLLAQFMCISDTYNASEQPSEVYPKLQQCIAQIEMLETYLNKVIEETRCALAEKRHKTIAAHIKKCQEINKMVFKRHFELTESRPEFEGSYVNVIDRAAYRETLAELNRFLPDATDLHIPQQVKRAEKAIKKVRALIRSVKTPASKLLSTCS